ncbi:hypothetical protein TNCV_1487621 [Trichonephila clavipes]|nr:hypothetical protein TNCV_1487621 [Trichonephila clavipes]
MLFVDIAKAFGKISHDSLISKMMRLGFSDELINIIHSYLNSREFRYGGLAQWLRYPTMAGMSVIPVPLKTRRVGQRSVKSLKSQGCRFVHESNRLTFGMYGRGKKELNSKEKAVLTKNCSLEQPPTVM